MAAGGARPQLVHTGDFGGSSQKPTVNAAVEKVQTGGFGDPNGLKGEGKQGAKLYAAAAGGLTCPLAPDKATDQAEQKESRARWPAQTLVTALRPAARATAAATARELQPADLDRSKSRTADRRSRKRISVRAATPVEITYKPNPVYTDEARSLKLEGEVLLEVSFGANGTLHVNRVVRGLGHGLDEAAHRRRQQDPFQAGHARWSAGRFHRGRSRDVPDGVLKFWRSSSDFGNGSS